MIFFARQKYLVIFVACFALIFFVFSHETFAAPDLADLDSDGISDEVDNCKEVPNTDQADADADGIGDWCEEDTERFGFELKAGTAPNSILSIFDSLGETFGLFFTFNSEKKAEKALKYAEEKLAEMRQMMAAGNEKAAKKANDKYVYFMGVAKTKVDALQGKEQFSDIAGKAMKIINAYEDIVRQHGKEKWQKLEDGAAGAQADFISAVDVAPFAIAAPLGLSQEERRERLCGIASQRKIKDETSRIFDTLCSAEFSAGMSIEDKKTILYATLFEAFARKDLSDRAKILLHQIIFTHLPREEEERVGGAFLRRVFAVMADSEVKLLAEGSIFDPSFPPQEAGSQAREDQAVREMEQAVRKMRDNCPAPGYSSYHFWVACSVNDFVTDKSYSDEYAESGGPCKYNEMGSVEATHIQSDTWHYSGSQQEAGPDGVMKPKRSKEIVCSVACASHNCGQYEGEQTVQKGCENPAVYYLMDSPMSEEILLDMCRGRGVSDKIVPKEKTGFWGGLAKGIGKLFGGGGEGSEEEEIVDREDLGNGYERIITRKNCELFNCTETELEFKWGKRKVKSCCCTCAPNDETHRSRNVFDGWDWPGDNLIDRFLSRKQDILKQLEGLRDAFQTPTPTANDQQSGSGSPGSSTTGDAATKDTTVMPGNQDAATTPPANVSTTPPSATKAKGFFWLEMPVDLGTHKVGESFAAPVTIHRRSKDSYTMDGKLYERVLQTKQFHGSAVGAAGADPRIHIGFFEAGAILSPQKITDKPPLMTFMSDDTFAVAGDFTCVAKGESAVNYTASIFYDYYDEVDKSFDADKLSTVRNASAFSGDETLRVEGKVKCVEAETLTLPTGDYTVGVYHKCNVTEGKNVDGKFEAKLRAEISTPEVSGGGQVLYPRTNPVEFRSGICEGSSSEIPICQDPRYSAESNYAQSKSFAYTEEYKYPANSLKKEIDKTVQEDMGFMTSGKRPCTSSELGFVPQQETAVGYFEFLDPSNNWQPISNVKVPGKTHVIVATDGTPDVHTFLPIDIMARGADGVIWYTYYIADNPANCRNETGCSRDIEIPAEKVGKPFTLEAWGDNGEFLAKHEQ